MATGSLNGHMCRLFTGLSLGLELVKFSYLFLVYCKGSLGEAFTKYPPNDPQLYRDLRPRDTSQIAKG
jgi:hypothetical protein